MSIDSVWFVNTVAWLHGQPVIAELLAFIAAVALIILEGLL